jgi:polyisoprenoid-binding protein YceI
METTVINTKTKWNIDVDHSEIGFKVKHLMVANVREVLKNLMVAFILRMKIS